MSTEARLPITPAELFEAANRCLASGDVAGFDGHIDRFLRLLPDSHEGHLLAAASFEPRDVDKAEKLYRTAQKLRPDCAEAAAGLVRCAIARRREPELSQLARMARLPLHVDVINTAQIWSRYRQWKIAATLRQDGEVLRGVLYGKSQQTGSAGLVLRPLDEPFPQTFEALEKHASASPGDVARKIEFERSERQMGRAQQGQEFHVQAPKPGRYLAVLVSAQGDVVGYGIPHIISIKPSDRPRGEVWWSHGGVVCGWIVGDSDQEPTVVIEGADAATITYEPLAYAGAAFDSGRTHYGFAALLPHESGRREIHLRDGRTGQALAGSPLILDGPTAVWWRPISHSFVIPPPDWHFLPRLNRSIAPSDAAGREPVDVIVPVYGGLSATQRCLSSVLNARNERACHLVVINDASPSPAITEYLRSLGEDPRITLLENQENKGFVGTVNAGMSVHRSCDVVILNADTVVLDGWLDRLTRCAYDSADIATVTPMSNNATILSYPQADESNPLPPNSELATLDQIFARGRNVPLEIPTGIGFCMLIKRACLDDVGDLDAHNFGRGYGEENEFCLRASARGWRHVCATNVLVGHEGGVSFAGEALDVQRQRMQTLNGLFSGYERYIARFVDADPLLPVRRAADIERLSDRYAESPTVLMVAPELGGGTARHVQDLCEGLKESGIQCLVLSAMRQPSGEKVWARLKDGDGDIGYPNLAFEVPFDFDLLIETLRRMKIVRVHVHHYLTLPWMLVDIARTLRLPYDVTVHDYGWVCPRVTMVGVKGQYCQEPDLAGCNTCIGTLGNRIEETIGVLDLRERSRQFVARAHQVFVPSPDVSTRLARYWPGIALTVRPHPFTPSHAAVGRVAPAGPPYVVAVLGAINADKGYDILLACARDAVARGLDLRFAVIGFTQDDAPLLRCGVSVSGKYREDELPHLFSRVRPHLGWVPSVCPETWNYSLSHILAEGLWPVAFDLGTPAQRLKGLQTGSLVPVSATPSQINDRLLKIACSNNRPQRLLDGGLYEDFPRDYYGFSTSKISPSNRRQNTVK